MHEIELPGLDGGNLLAFLAALGTLRILAQSESDSSVQMRWVDHGFWRPVIHHSDLSTAAALVDKLTERVCGGSSINESWNIGDDLTLKRADFHKCMESEGLKAAPDQRSTADFLAAFGSDAFGSGPKREKMSDTEFRTMSGAGHQHFLGYMKELARVTTSSHIRRALLEEWDYSDIKRSLRWDPADYRPHALRSIDPSDDPIKTMWGANRLAIEALPLFPVVAMGRRARTLGFQERRGETEITWPLWTDALELMTVSSVLAIEQLQQEDLKEGALTLARRGIVQVFRAQRFTDGKYRNFTPAKGLL
jgi:hypothetical protein